ncbi:MAG: AbrB/MazE/SpoVT family DNA-binding domain-containing protein [Chloroflexi bacterium]|nr:AbrB/MazE/SpoVT family DNA-binding domain-containing protein [Chloroflexota bacterium]
MVVQTLRVDEAGRITLPETILYALRLYPKIEVVIELVEGGAIIKPKHPTTPITERIAAMNLPVANWKQMEHEIEAGWSVLDFRERAR